MTGSPLHAIVDVDAASRAGWTPADLARAFLDGVPAAAVGEIHLAGHSLDAEGTLLIDSHDAPVNEMVWRLYESFVARIGRKPTLIERDGNVPPFAELMRERDHAQLILGGEELALAA